MKTINPTEKELHGLKSIINIAVQSSEYFSESSPKWLRPITKIIAFISTLFFMLLIAPFLLFKRKYPNSYQNLETELVARWHSESSIIALSKLREIYGLLIQNFESVMLGGYKIEPYGKFNFYDYTRVAELLYHWEMQHKNFSEALEICDEILRPTKDSNNISEAYASWVIKKARVLGLINGKLAAQEYLLAHVDPNNNECRVKDFLHELREAS